MDLFIGMEMGKDSKPFGTAFSVSRLRFGGYGCLRRRLWHVGREIHGFVGLEMEMRMNLISNGNGKGNELVFEWDGFTLYGMANPWILKSEFPNENNPHPQS